MAYIYLMIKQNKETIITGYEYSTNIIVSTLKVEKSNAEKEAQNKENMYIDKNITNYEEYDFSKSNNNKYYYNQLNGDSKLIYDTIEANLNNMKSGTYKIKLPNNVAETLKANDGEKILDKNFQSAWDALSLDRVDMFFIDGSKINLNIQKRTYGDNVAYSLEINPIDSGGYLENGLTDEISVNTVLKVTANIEDFKLSEISTTTQFKCDDASATAEGTINYNANIVEFTATDVASNKETVIKKIATETTKKQEPTQKLEKVQIKETKNASELDDSPKTDDYTNASTWIIYAGVAFIIAITSLVIGSSKGKY